MMLLAKYILDYELQIYLFLIKYKKSQNKIFLDFKF